MIVRVKCFESRSDSGGVIPIVLSDLVIVQASWARVQPGPWPKKGNKGYFDRWAAAVAPDWNVGRE